MKTGLAFKGCEGINNEKRIPGKKNYVKKGKEAYNKTGQGTNIGESILHLRASLLHLKGIREPVKGSSRGVRGSDLNSFRSSCKWI